MKTFKRGVLVAEVGLIILAGLSVYLGNKELAMACVVAIAATLNNLTDGDNEPPKP